MFRDYWEDIGTIKTFYDANMALTEEVRYISWTQIFFVLIFLYSCIICPYSLLLDFAIVILRI